MEKVIHLNGAEISISGLKVAVKGPKGELERDFSSPFSNGIVSIEADNESVHVKCESTRKKAKAMVGTIAAHIKNMITGVTKGYRYTMFIHHVHFPMNVEVKGNRVVIKNFLGSKGVREAKIPEGVNVKVEGNNIIIEGINKELVGMAATNIESACRVKKKDRRVFQDGIYLDKRMVME